MILMRLKLNRMEGCNCIEWMECKCILYGMKCVLLFWNCFGVNDRFFAYQFFFMFLGLLCEIWERGMNGSMNIFWWEYFWDFLKGKFGACFHHSHPLNQIIFAYSGFSNFFSSPPTKFGFWISTSPVGANPFQF